MEQTLKEQIYHAEAIYDKLMQNLMSDSKILQENKEAVKRYLANKSAEGITTVRLNIIFAGLLRVVRLSQKPFMTFTEQDVREVVGLLER